MPKALRSRLGLVLAAIFLGAATWAINDPGEWAIGPAIATLPWSLSSNHTLPAAETWLAVALNTVIWYLIGCGGSAALRGLRAWWQKPISSKVP